MAKLTEGKYPGDWLKWEQDNLYSREEITVKSGLKLESGTVLGFEDAGVISSQADAGNTGDGVMGAVTAGPGVKVGDYRVAIIEPAANAGAFIVEDPEGVVIGQGTVAVAFAGEVAFTLADGAADFAAGDAFTITVAEAVAVVAVASPETAANGSEVAEGILFETVDATAAATKGVMITRQALVNPQELTYHATIDDAAKRAAKLAQLKARGILEREGA